MHSQSIAPRHCHSCGTLFTPKDPRSAGFCTPRCWYASNTRPLADRFWEKVKKVDDDLGCWEWTASTFGGGYGQIWVCGRGLTTASVVALEMALGRRLERGELACHTCDNPPCVRNDGVRSHLFPATTAGNALDMVQKGRGRHPVFQGAAHPQARLTEDDVRAIRRRYAAGEASQSALGREYGVPQTHISRIVLRTGWASVP